MKTGITALFSGIVFGFGLNLSQMVNPEKVLAFLDITGNWDPSLALVMAGALAVALPLYSITLKRTAPLLAEKFELPVKQQLDKSLLLGATLFGCGWGLAGYCPGPALAAMLINWQEAIPFVIAMAVGGKLCDILLAVINVNNN